VTTSLSTVALLLLCFGSLSTQAQARRVGGIGPKPQGGGVGVLTVAALPNSVTLSLVSGGVASASGPVAVTTSWSGIALFSTITLYGYFSNSTAALSGGTPVSNLPSSCVLGMMPTGTPTSFTAFTQSTPFGGAGSGLQLFSSGSLLNISLLTGSRTDNLSLRIDLSTIPQLPAATYTGVLILQAQLM
jgi:hypothetical protein